MLRGGNVAALRMGYLPSICLYHVCYNQHGCLSGNTSVSAAVGINATRVQKSRLQQSPTCRSNG
jgi:hypothetical protein